MSLKINASSLFKKHYLLVDSGGVKFFDGSVFGAKRFPFSKIACVLMSPDHKLSFQVSNEVFSIQTNPNKAKHQQVVTALLQEVQRTAHAGITE